MFMAANKAGGVRRRRLLPGQGRLIGASAMVAVGSFLPWIQNPELGRVFTIMNGADGGSNMGPAYWTFIAAMLGLAGGLVPARRFAVVNAWLMAATAVILSGWQLLDILTRVGVAGWSPGIGIVLVFFGGLFAATAARTLSSLQAAPVGTAVNQSS